MCDAHANSFPFPGIFSIRLNIQSSITLEMFSEVCDQKTAHVFKYNSYTKSYFFCFFPAKHPHHCLSHSSLEPHFPSKALAAHFISSSSASLVKLLSIKWYQTLNLCGTRNGSCQCTKKQNN